MNKKPIIIWGASGHAKAAFNLLNYFPDYEVIGFLDDINVTSHGHFFMNKKILGGSDCLKKYINEGVYFVLGFGNCQRRIEIGNYLQKQGCQLPSFIHPKAIVAPNIIIEDGVLILSGAIIDTECKIGAFSIINNGAIISHECFIQMGTHICPGVSIGGKTNIGEGSWIGIGSSIIDKIKIGSNSYIGAGSVVIKDVPDNYLAYGNPAKLVRELNTSF